MKCKYFLTGEDDMKVSIITPCFNSEKTIRQTIESVLNQTYFNIEYIIIDGGSTDDTVAIIKEYIPLFHGRLHYISEKDNGIYEAMNKGIKLSHGQLIGIINSDDYYEPNTVETVVKYCRQGREQVIYGYMNILVKNAKIKVLTTSHTKLNEGMITHPTCFVTRNVYQKYGLFVKCFKIAADYELMLRLFKKTDVEFVQIPQVLANFRSGGISSTKKTQLEKHVIQLRYNCITIKEFMNFLINYLFLLK